MTMLEGLIFLFSVGSIAFLIEASVMLAEHQWWWRRALVAALLVGLGVNAKFGDHLWQSLIILILAVSTAALPHTRSRFFALSAIALGGPFLFSSDLASDLHRDVFEPDRTDILLVTSGFLFAVVVGSGLVEAVIKRVRGLPSSSAEAEKRAGAPAGGQIIGMLERALVFGAVLVGHPEAVALVVAVKSVARFPEFDRDRAFAEYFLIGTILSLLFALGVAYLVRAALAVT